MNANLQDVTNFAFRPQFAENTINALMQSVSRALVQDDRGYCEFEFAESFYGACDGGQKCSRQGDVSDIQSVTTLCMMHFRRVK